MTQGNSVLSDPLQFMRITSYCSYARPAQPGPIRRLGPKQT